MFVYSGTVQQYNHRPLRSDLAQWVARLTRNVEDMGLSPIKSPRCFLEQETFPLFLSIGWSQEWI